MMRILSALLVLTGWLHVAIARAEPNVAASIKPVQTLVAAVMAGTGSPGLILGTNSSPHDTALKPSQRHLIAGADIIFHIGGGLEGPLERPLEQKRAEGTTIIALIDTPGLELLEIRENAIWPTDNHAHDNASHDTANHDGHAIDPHIWLDPQNASLMTQYIADVLAKADPGNADLYQSNAKSFAAQLNQLQDKLIASLESVRKVPFVVFHDGYQYFEHRFGLTAAGAIAANPDKRPGAKRLHSIRQLIASKKAACVFAEPQFEISYVTTVIEGTSVRTATLDPLGANLENSKEGYIALITTLADTITQCLSAD